MMAMIYGACPENERTTEMQGLQRKIKTGTGRRQLTRTGSS